MPVTEPRWTFWLDDCPCCGDALEIHTTAPANADTGEQEAGEPCFNEDGTSMGGESSVHEGRGE